MACIWDANMWRSPGWALTGRTEDGSRAGGTARVSCASWASSPARCLLRILVTLMLKSSFPKSLLYWSLLIGCPCSDTKAACISKLLSHLLSGPHSFWNWTWKWPEA